MKVDTHWTRQTFENLIRILPALRPKKGEGEEQHRARVRRELSTRWATNGEPIPDRTMKAFLYDTDKAGYRRPRESKHAGFFRDLRQFGAARFTKSGDVVESSLGKGPDPGQFYSDMPAGGSA